MDHSLIRLVAENYPRVASDLLEPMLAILQLARKYFGGDLDSFLMLLVIAIRTTDHQAFASESPERLISGEIPVFPGLGTNIRSVADSLGIPKETARRKIQDLLDTGWVARQDGQLFFTARAHQDLAPLREEIEKLAVHYFEIVASLNAANAGRDAT